MSGVSKKEKKIKIHYGYDVSDISGEPLFSIGYEKIYNKKGRLKKVKVSKLRIGNLIKICGLMCLSFSFLGTTFLVFFIYNRKSLFLVFLSGFTIALSFHL